MAKIHVLDETTINKIAAGEVVERPASVVKELVENSIDAGATSIEIEIGEGGTNYMRISDNGSGMSEEDARLAVLRHATSKIKQVEDLFDISSLGFRGEALASIAAVSHFTLITRLESDELGTKITINGGIFEDCMPYGAKPGTTIEVKDLFYNTPARRKFLKTSRTEGSKIQDIIGKLALSNPQIAFKLVSDDKISIVTPGNDSIVDTVAALYGYKVTEDIFPIEYESEGIYIQGVVSKPTILKSSRIWQTLIVNNRVVSDKAVTKAIDNAYHALLPKGGFPLVILNMVVPSESVDINVHPRKSEVKFSDDKPIYKAVYHAVLSALENNATGTGVNAVGIADNMNTVADELATTVRVDKVFGNRSAGYEVVRERTEDFVRNLREKGYEAPKRVTYEQDSFIASGNMESPIIVPRSYTQEDKKRFHEEIVRMQSNFGANSEESAEVDLQLHEPAQRHIQTSGLLPMGQVASCYILAKKGDDLYIIDQHAAHERVRYDKLCKSAEAIPMQELLVPIYVNASEDEMILVEEQESTLLDLGFAVTLGGPKQIKIEGLPVDILESKAADVLRFIFSYLHDEQSPTKAQLRHEVLAYASCRGAIKAGHNLNMYQISVLIEDLFHTDKPFVCPHGRPTIIKFTPEELGKLFNRS